MLNECFQTYAARILCLTYVHEHVFNIHVRSTYVQHTLQF